MTETFPGISSISLVALFLAADRSFWIWDIGIWILFVICYLVLGIYSNRYQQCLGAL